MKWFVRFFLNQVMKYMEQPKVKKKEGWSQLGCVDQPQERDGGILYVVNMLQVWNWWEESEVSLGCPTRY